MSKIGIVGSGSWGITLGTLLLEKGNEVTILCRNQEKKLALEKTRRDPVRLGDFTIPDDLNFSADPEDLINQEYVIIAIPSEFLREYLKKIQNYIVTDKLISVIKGIEEKTFKMPSEIIKEFFPEKKIAVLSGPSIAREVLAKIPTSVVVASVEEKYAQEVQLLFHTNYFRVYFSKDVKGCELGGATKNVIAIAAGILDGLGFGANTKGALIVRGAREIMRLGEKLGAHPLTISGLSGIGDLITTCFSPYSRNRIVGEELAKGKNLGEILTNLNMVAEGVHSSHVIFELSRKINVEMPVVEMVHKILMGEITPREAIDRIMNRPPKPEIY
ncbi:MAG: NAD(P)H-dependent glycerol-3-phosphate dehydrogenase [candidate division WOR-3 bacterium]